MAFTIFIHLNMCLENILYVCVYYYHYLYVFYYMLDIGERDIELMFSVYSHTDENKDYLHLLSTNKNEHCRQVIEAIEEFAFPARTPCLDWCRYWKTDIMSQMVRTGDMV